MEKEEAARRIQGLLGQDLCALAKQYGVTIFKGGKKNKGWPGHVIECALGLPRNCLQEPDLGECELKVVSLARRKRGGLRVKETMAITMLNPADVISKEFEESHLYMKLRNLLVASRIFEDKEEPRSILYSVAHFALGEPEIYAKVKADYDLVRLALRAEGFSALTSSMGELVQPRTKGPGHGSTTRAFYARAAFVSKILGLTQ